MEKVTLIFFRIIFKNLMCTPSVNTECSIKKPVTNQLNYTRTGKPEEPSPPRVLLFWSHLDTGSIFVRLYVSTDPCLLEVLSRSGKFRCT